jgi:CubicO group peptidase (beta-lactamase class C family)
VPQSELELLVRRAQSEHRLPGVSATVVVRGETVMETAVGIADAGSGVEASLDTQFRIGSITKTFTAAAVLTLAGEGKLALDDPLDRHLDAAAGRPLTIRRLLAHSSGLQRELVGTAWETLVFPSTEELLVRLDEAEQVLDPGAQWHYSNLAYALLGEVVARASGQPYEEFVAERFLRGEPGLGRTTWERAEPAARGFYVDPFANVLRPEGEIERAGSLSAAGNLWSTTGDLCSWAAWLGGREPMHAVQVMADPDQWLLAWGLGLMLHRRGDRILYGHDGAMPGFLASFCASRQEDVQAAVLTNASTPSSAVTGLALALVERAIEDTPRPPEPWRGEAAPPAEIAELLGNWWSEGMEFVFRWRGGRLEATLVGASPRVKPSVFAADGPGRYRVTEGREQGELLEVVRDGSGAVEKLLWATYPFTRKPEVMGTPAD